MFIWGNIALITLVLFLAFTVLAVFTELFFNDYKAAIFWGFICICDILLIVYIANHLI